MNLELRSPLFYVKTDSLPAELTDNDEYLLIFELNPVQSQSIEPEPHLLLGELVFSGRALSPNESGQAAPAASGRALSPYEVSDQTAPSASERALSPNESGQAAPAASERALSPYEVSGQAAPAASERALSPYEVSDQTAPAVSERALSPSLPAGRYLFTQCRSKSAVKNREEWLDMAIEQQKDGLWERNKIENRLYARFLYEDGEHVTQLFRRITNAVYSLNASTI